MTRTLERTTSLLVAVGAVAFVIATTGTTLEVVAGAAFLVSTVVERRSTSWILLVAALLLVGPASGVLAAVALTSPGMQRDLAHQGTAAVRRSFAAMINPMLALGGSFGAYRFGSREKLLWWFIGWVPAVLIAVLTAAFTGALAATQSAMVAAVAGTFLSLESAQTLPSKPTVRPAAGGQTFVAVAGGTSDWTDVVGVLPVRRSRSTPPVKAPNDARDLEESAERMRR